MTSARRPDEHDAEPVAQFGELGTFGDEAPADPGRIGARRDERPFQRGEVEIRGPGVRGAVVVQTDGLVRLAHEHRRPFGPRVQGDHAEIGTVTGGLARRLVAQLAYGIDQAHRGFTPIDHRDPVDSPVHRGPP